MFVKHVLRLILSGCHDGIARLWDFETGNEVYCFEGHTAKIERGVAFSPNGDLIATGANDKTVKIWRVPGSRSISTSRHSR